MDEDIAVGLFGGALFAFLLLYVAVLVVIIASAWKVFTKAGKPGWAAIIPIYNVLIAFEIAGRPGWWFLLMLVPLLNIAILFIVAIDFAKSFGQSTGFGIGLALLSIVFLPILAFGNATYRGPAALTAAATAG